MSTNLVGIPLATDPFLQLLFRDFPGDPGTDVAIYSKLATTPSKIKASRTNAKLALVTDLRAEDIEGIGTGSGNIPQTGIRVINYNDRFIFFGGDATHDATMFEKTNFFYRDTGTADDLPIHPEVVGVGAFTRGGAFFVCTFSSAPGNTRVFRFTGSDEDDARGEWSLDSTPLLSGATVTDIWISPLNNFLVVQNATNFRLFDIQANLAPLTGAITGQLLAINSDETEWLYVTTGDIKTATYAAGALTDVDTLPSSAGTGLSAAYSPDDDVIVVMGQPTTGLEMPRFYTVSAGDYVYSRGITRANFTSWQNSKVVFKDNSQFAVANKDGAASRVELYSRDTIVPNPFTPDSTLLAVGNNGLGITSMRDNTGYFIASGDHVMHWNGATYDDVTPTGYNSTVRVSQSLADNGAYLMTGTTTSVPFWHWSGTAFVSKATPIASPTSVRSIALSPDGLTCSVVRLTGSTGTLQFFAYNVGANTWSQIGSNITLTTAFTTARSAWCPGRNDLMAICVQGSSPQVYKLISGTWTAQAALPVPSGFTTSQGFDWSPDGNYLAAGVRDASLNWRLAVFHRDASDVFTLVYQSPSTLINGTVCQQIAYAVDGKYVAWCHNSGSFPLGVWEVSGVTYTPKTVPSAPSTVGIAVCFTVRHLVWFSQTTSPKWIYDMSGILQTYALEHTFTLSGTALATYLTYNPDGTVFEYGRSNDSHHVGSITPYTALSSLTYATDRTPAQVHNVIYSDTGKVVIFDTPDGPEIAVRPNTGSDFLNPKNIHGRFVFLYDLDGTTYVERSWTEHVLDARIRDITFSDNEDVLSYHIDLPVGAPGDASRGRLLFDVSGSDRFEFRGQVWEAAMTSSYVAFSPFNTHFVVTHEHLVSNDPVITLHEFTTDYAWTNQDNKPVAFGPPAWSKCADVVVAHGGDPQLSFFKHDDTSNVLIPRPVEISWEYEGTILDIAFADDCKGFVVLGPDHLFPFEENDDDSDKYDEKDDDTNDDDDLDEPAVESGDDDHDTPNITVDVDGHIHIDPNDIDKSEHYPGDYEWVRPNPPVSINYVPYSVVTVTFRVASIPS